jgi:hypothetical protein
MTWADTVEAVRADGDKAANALLDRYYRRRFATVKSCWVAKSRKRIEHALDAARKTCDNIAEKRDAECMRTTSN